jgi:hypothetical protein
MFHFVGSRTMNKRQLPTDDRSARFHKCGAIAVYPDAFGLFILPPRFPQPPRTMDVQVPPRTAKAIA